MLPMKTHLTKFILFALILIGSCSKDESNNDTPSVSNTYSITIAGQINDENGQGIPNVTVQVGNKIDQTDGNGIYLIEKASVNKSRAVVKATKTGYWNRSSGFIPSNSKVQYCNFVMPTKSPAAFVSSSAGGTVSNTGATVFFPPNAFVNAAGMPFSGNVLVITKHLTTTNPNFGNLVQGTDLMAEDSVGGSVKLVSFGMIGVELTDNNGNPLQLAPGIKANIQLPIASGQLSGAPATIPLWYFDETKSLWIEEGLATKQGNNYLGQVEHFTWWNYDQPFAAATIEGYVFDCEGNPIQNAKIFNNNIGSIFTDQNGFYSGLINSGSPSTVNALFAGIYSNIINIPALSPGQIYTVPNITFSCTGLGKLKVNFVDCNNLAINPSVFITSSMGNLMIIPNGGSINAFVPCGSNVLSASILGATYSNSYIQMCSPDSTDLGTLIICDTTSSSTGLLFNFSATSLTHNLNFSNPTQITGFFDSTTNIMELNGNSSNPQQQFEGYITNYFSYIPGTYTPQNFPNWVLDFEYYSGSNIYYINADTLNPSLTISILKNGAIGDTMEVIISGNITILDNNTSMEESGVLNSLHVKCIRNQ